MDGQGQPHIAYFDQIDHVVRYTWFDGSTWQFEMVDSASGEVSLAIDSLDRPHVLYCVASGLSELRYACHDGGLWAIIPVSTSAGPELGWHPSLAVDDQCDPHVSFTSYPGLVLKYAHLTGGIWTVEVVDPFDDWDDGGTRTAIALDPRGVPHIVYGAFGHHWQARRYAQRTPLGWMTEQIGGTGDHLCIGADDDNLPHVSCNPEFHDPYDGYSYYRVAYGVRAGTGWAWETVDTVATGPTSLALDVQGQPHIAYHGRGTYPGMRYASRDASGWHLETVYNQQTIGAASSLALDSDGHPHISFYHESYGALVYATASTLPAPPSGASAARELRLEVVGPSPSFDTVMFRLWVPSPVRARVNIFDLNGRRIRQLCAGETAPLVTELLWDGRNAEGVRVPCGVYIASVSALGVRSSIPFVLLR